jgi:hypothetical protein
MDSPRTTSAVTYTIQGMAAFNGLTINQAAEDLNWDPDGGTIAGGYTGTRSISTITVMEVVP